jgi:hypothetical protein
MVCFVNDDAFAKLTTAKSASFDDIRKGMNLHNESTADFADKLMRMCSLCNLDGSNLICHLPFLMS